MSIVTAKLKKIAEKIVRTRYELNNEENLTYREKLKNAYDHFMEELNELREILDSATNKTAGISLQDQKISLNACLRKLEFLVGHSKDSFDQSIQIIKNGVCEQVDMNYYIEMRGELIKAITHDIRKVDTFAHTVDEHKKVRTCKNNLASIKIKFDILITKLEKIKK